MRSCLANFQARTIRLRGPLDQCPIVLSKDNTKNHCTMHFLSLNILQWHTMSDQTSQSPVSLPRTDQYDPRGSIPNTVFAVALIASILGAVGGSSLALASQTLFNAFAGTWARPQLGIYLGAMCIFHLMEFFTTAGWNPQKLSVDGRSIFVWWVFKAIADRI